MGVWYPASSISDILGPASRMVDRNISKLNTKCVLRQLSIDKAWNLIRAFKSTFDFAYRFQILTVPMGTVSWVDYDGSSIPLNAIQAGNDPNGAAYYIGRVIHQGTVTVGKVHRVGNQGTCFIPYGMVYKYSHFYHVIILYAMYWNYRWQRAWL